MGIRKLKLQNESNLRTRRRRVRAALAGSCVRSFEQLEERRLLAIDVSVVAGSPVFSGDVAADLVTLSLNSDNELQYSTDGINFIKDMITATPAVDVLLIDSITQIDVNLGAGVDALTIDISLSDALATVGIPLSFGGGGDDDTLIGPEANSQWDLTGEDAGILNTWITFSSVESLVGSGASDTFAISDGGALSGTIDGGGSSDDTLDFSARTAMSNANLLTGTASGTGGIRNIEVVLGEDDPVLFVPGFAGSFARDTSPAGVDYWLTHRGMAPEDLQLEILGNSYNDIVKTFENIGYSINSVVRDTPTLFVATWDWRVPVAPQDSTADGLLDGPTGGSISDTSFDTGLDYLGYWLKQVADQWRDVYGTEIDSVDLVTHSTGGLVARSYIQSTAYGDGLPTVDSLVLAGVPSEGTADPWEILQNDFNGSSAKRILGRLISSGYDRLLAGEDIVGPGTTTIDASTWVDNAANRERFVGQYVGALRDLLPTNEFIQPFGSSDYETLASPYAVNELLIDLNGNLANRDAFIGLTGKTTVVYSSSQETATFSEEFPPPSPGLEVLPFDEYIENVATSTWYEEISIAGGGDATVTTASALPAWFDTASPRLTVDEITNVLANEPKGVGHRDLTRNKYSQTRILAAIDPNVVDPNLISTNLAKSNEESLLTVISLGLLDPGDILAEANDDFDAVVGVLLDYGIDAAFGEATIDDSDPNNLIINDTNYFDRLILENNPNVDGGMLLRNAEDGTEFILFANPAGSLTINLGNNLVGPFFGADVLTVLSVDPAFTGNLIINGEFGATDIIFDGLVHLAGGDVSVTADDVTVTAGSVLSTRRVASGADPVTATSVGESGAITFNALASSDELSRPSITVGNSAQLLTHTDYRLENPTVPASKWTASRAFTGLSPVIARGGSSGIGLGMLVDITTDAQGNPQALLTAAGRGYAQGDTVTFLPPDLVGDPVSFEVVYSHQPGTITLLSESVAGFAGLLVARVRDTDATITLSPGSVIKGGDVTMTATADSDRIFDDNSGFVETTIEFLESLTSLAGVAISSADANIIVASGAVVEASDLAITAEAIARAQVRAIGTAIGVVYAESNSTAKIDVQSGAQLVSRGDVTIASDAESEINASALTASLGAGTASSPADASIAFTQSTIESTAGIAAGAVVRAGGDVQLTADMKRETFTRASSGAYESGALGIALAISLSEGNVNAMLDGHVLAGGKIDVIATADTPKNDTETSSGVGSGFGPGLVKGAASGVAGFIGRNSPVPKPRSGSQPLAVSAAFTYAEHSTDTIARVGSSGQAIALDGGVSITATTTDIPETAVVATIDSEKLSASPTGLTKENSVAAAIVVGKFDNTTEAYVGESAIVNASGDVSVFAETRLPYEIQYFQFTEPGDFTDKINSNFGIQNGFFTSWAQSNAQGTKLVVAGTVNVLQINNNTQAYIARDAWINQDLVFDPSSTTNDANDLINFGVDHQLSQGDRVIYNNGGGESIAGLDHGQTYFVIRESARSIKLAKILGGEAIDLSAVDATGATHSFAKAAAHGQVHVQAQTQNETVNLSGVFGLKFFGTQAGAGGVGGAYLDFGNTNFTTAEIHDGAQIFGEALLVSSDSKARSISIAESGGAADTLSLNGSFAINETNNVTTARVDDGASVTLGEASIVIDKSFTELFGDDSREYFTEIAFDNESLIENIPNVLDSNRDGKLTTTDAHITENLGSSYRTNLSQLIFAEDELEMFTVGGGIAKSRNVGVGFTVGINEINRFVEAVVGQAVFGGTAVDAQRDEIHLGHRHGLATGDAVKYSNGGGSSIGGLSDAPTYYVIVIDPNTIQLASSRPNAEAGIAISSLDPSTATGAAHSIRRFDEELGSGTIASAGEALVSAMGAGTIGSFSLAAAVTSDTPSSFQASIGPQAAGKYGIGFSGAVSLNTINDSIAAYVSNANVIHSGDLGLNAFNDTVIFGLSGAAAVSTNASSASGGLAGSYSQNTLNLATRAFVLKSTLMVAGSLDLDATADGDITVITVSGAGATSGPGLAGAVSVNDITSDTRASIMDSSIVIGDTTALIGNASVSVRATDDTDIFAIAGSLAKGGALAGIGSTVALNDIAGGAIVEIVDSDVEIAAAVGSLFVEAETTAEIQAIAASLAFSPSLAAAISVSQNTISNATRSLVRGQRTRGIKTRNGDWTLSATDNSTIDALAGSVSGGANSVGAAVGINDIANSVETDILSTQVDVSGRMVASSSSTATINALTVGGAGAGSFALGGSVSLNEIDNTLAARILNTSTFNANSLSLTSTDTSTINSFAGGFAGSGGSAVGAAVATNTIGNETVVEIEDTRVDATGAITVSATTTATIQNITVGGAGAASFALGGSVSLNEISNLTSATIDGAPLLKGSLLSLTATDISTIDAFAGGFALGAGAVGAALATNDIRSTTEVEIRSSSIEVGGSIVTSAITDANIESIAVGGAGAGGFALGGSIALNELANQTEARLATVPMASGSQLTLTALDTSMIDSFAGGFSVSLGGVAIGAALATNELANTVETELLDSMVDVSGSATITATSDATIDSVAVGGAGADTFALGGSIALNDIGNTVAARTKNAMVEASSLLFASSDTSFIDSFAGGFAIAISGAVGAAVTTNAVDNTSTTEFDKSQAFLSGSATVQAVSDTTMDSKAVGGAGALLFGGAGSSVDNSYDSKTTLFVGDESEIRSDGSLTMVARSMTDLVADTGSYSGGIVGVGLSFTDVGVNSSTDASVGADATIVTGGDFTLLSDTIHKIDADAVYGGGGALSIALADASVVVVDTTLATIGQRASITSDGLLSVAAHMDTDADSNASVTAIGGVALAYPESETMVTATTATLIKPNASLRGNVVQVEAIVSELDVDSKTTAWAGAVGADANADATTTTLSTVDVTIQSGADIVGETSVVIAADQIDLPTSAWAKAEIDGLLGDGDPSATNTLTVVSNVTVLDNVEIATRDLLVKSAAETAPGFSATAELDGALIEFGDDSESKKLNYTRTIAFNGDIKMLGARSPELEIDESGAVVKQENIQIVNNGSGTPVIVTDLVNDSVGLLAGRIEFRIPTSVYDTVSNGDVTAIAQLTGAPTIVFLTSFERVSITNHSDRELVVNGIDVLSDADSFTANITIDVPPGALGGYTTPTPQAEPGETEINIFQTGDNQVSLEGFINNPLGTTSIQNTVGSIVSEAGASITSVGVTLGSDHAQIGNSEQAPIKIASQSLAVNARGDIFVQETLGNLNIVEAISNEGSTFLKAAGAILDSTDDEELDIQGVFVSLVAIGGSIGGAGRALEIDASDQNTALTAIAAGDIVLSDLAQGLSINKVEATNGDIRITLPDTPAVTEPGFRGEDLILLADATIRAIRGSIELFVGDNVFLADSSQDAGLRAAGTITITGDDDPTDPDPGNGTQIDLRGTIIATARILGSNAVTITGGADPDFISLTKVYAGSGIPGVQVGIDTAGGADTIRIGSNASADPLVDNLDRGGVLANINGPVVIVGGGAMDTVELDDSGNLTGNAGVLSDTAVSGFDMTAGVQYGGVEELKITLGNAADFVTIESTAAQATTIVSAGGGDDAFVVRGTDNTVNQIAGLLILEGGADVDSLVVDDSGDTVANMGILDGNRIKGLGLGSQLQNVVDEQKGISIDSMATVEIFLGSHVDTFSIAASTANSMIDAGGGSDVLSIGPSSVGDLADPAADPADLARILGNVDIRGGDGANTLLIRSDVPSDIGLNGAGSVTVAAASGQITFAQISVLSIVQSELDGDRLTVSDTPTDLFVNARGGIDNITIETISHATQIDVGTGDDVVKVMDVQAALTVNGTSDGSGFDTLTVDRSAQTQPETGGILGDGIISGVGSGVIAFNQIDGVEIRLGKENNAFEIDTRLPETAVLVVGGPSDDTITVRSIGGPSTTIDGGGEIDTVLAVIDGQPTPNQFSTLFPTVETLVVDNRGNAVTPVDWLAVDGTIVRASVPSFNGGAPFDVIPISGADVTRILGGEDELLVHTLEVIANTPANVEGSISGNQVDIKSGLVVLQPAGFGTFQNFDEVVDFDDLAVQLPNNAQVYTEDGFSLSTTGTFELNDEVSPALAAASDSGVFKLQRTLSTDSDASNDEVFSLYSLTVANDSTTPAPPIIFSGITLSGALVSKVVPSLAAKAGANDQPVFTLVEFGEEFASLKEVAWSPGAVIVDNIVARVDNFSSGIRATVPIVPIYTIGGNIQFDTANRRLASGTILVDVDRDMTIDHTITTSTNLANGAYGVTASFVPNLITEFAFAGDLNFQNAGTKVSATGTQGLSLRVANDAFIDPGVIFDFSADGRDAIAGGRAGGSGGTGGTTGGGGGAGGLEGGFGGDGNGSAVGEGGEGGEGGAAGGAGAFQLSDGSPGEDGQTGESGDAGVAGGPGGRGGAGTSGINAPSSGAASTANGQTVGGTLGGGGSGLGAFGEGGEGSEGVSLVSFSDPKNGEAGGDGGKGDAGSEGGDGNTGLSGQGGRNTGTLQLISGGGGGQGGGGGSKGGGGGGGQSGGGGGGGGGGGTRGSIDGGAGGWGEGGGGGGSGQAGGDGGSGGVGGAGGGAFQLVALGRVTIGGANFSAEGGHAPTLGQAGGPTNGRSPTGSIGEGVTRDGESGEGTNREGAEAGSGGEGGIGGVGGDGGPGGTGGQGGVGGGGGGGSIRIVGTVLAASTATVDTDGGEGGNTGDNDGDNGRFIAGGNTSIGGTPNANGQVTSVGGAPSSNRLSNVFSSFFVGPRGGNSYVDFDDNPLTRDQVAPYIAGLAGGADLHGFLGIDVSELDFDPWTLGVQGIDTLSGVTVSNDALAAIVRVGVGPVGFGDDYTGYDMLLFVNLTDIALSNPMLGISNQDSDSYSERLSIRGLGSTQYLDVIGPGEVWATLIPDTSSIFVDASIAGSASKIAGRSLTKTGADSVRFISSEKAALSVAADIGGLDAIAVGPSGEQIYGVNTAQDALVVANADGTQRQLFKNGLDGVSGMANPMDVEVSVDGRHVYVVGSAGIVVFNRELGSGNLDSPRLIAVSGDDLALSPSADRLYVAGATTIASFARDSGTGELAAITSVTEVADELVTSRDGSLVFAVNEANDRLSVFQANSLARLQSLSGASLGLDGASNIAVSGDDQFVYVTGRDGNTLSVFMRESGTNTLAHVQTLTNGDDGVSGLAEPTDVLVTPDDAYVLVTAKVSNAISVFQRDATTGELLFVQILRNNLGGLSGLNAPNSIASNPTGTNTYFGTLGASGFIGGLVDTTRNPAEQPVAINSITTFENMRELTVTTASGDDTIKLLRAPDETLASNSQILAVGKTTIDTQGGQDTVIIEDASPATDVFLGAGSDTAIVNLTTPDIVLTLVGDAGTETADVSEDTFEIEAVGGGTTVVEIFGGEDNDTVNVTGTALPPTSDPQVGRLVAHGDDPSGVIGGDRLIFDPQNPNPNTPNYTPAQPNPNEDFLSVNGFGAVDYDTFEGVIVVSAPIITFQNTPFATAEGQGITLSASANLLGASPADPLLWDIDGDGLFGELVGNSVNLSWELLQDFGLNDDGAYQVGVRASSILINGTRAETEKFIALTIANALPNVTRQGNSSVNVGEVFQLEFAATDFGDDRISEWRVDWGDGTSEVFGTGTHSASHIYTEPDNYSITVGAVDEDTFPNATNAPVLQVRVGVVKTQVRAGGTYVIQEGDSLTLNATAIGTPISFEWDLDADPQNPAFDVDATGSNPTLTWAELQALSPTPIDNNGTTPLFLRAIYASGLSVVSEVAFLTVTNKAPTADLEPISPVFEGTSDGVAQVSFVNASDPSAADSTFGFDYSYDFDNDGFFEIKGSPLPTAFIPAVYLSDNGTGTVRGRIEDQDGGFTDVFATYTVREVAPTLVAIGSPDPVIEGAVFTLSLRAEDPGNDQIDRWTINWGDGSVPETVFDSAPTLTHRFVDNGNPLISITAIDEDGIYTTSFSTAVDNAIPTLRGLSASSVDENGISVLRGTIGDDGRFDTFSIQVTWGDDVTESFDFPAGTTDFAVVHQYLDDNPSNTEADNYGILVILADDDGGEVTSGTTVTVSNVAPEIVSFALVNEIIIEGGFAQIVGALRDVGSADTHTVVVQWGDSTSSFATLDPATRTFRAEHQYRDDQPNNLVDEYVIRAQATDDDSGISASVSTVVTVNNRAPEISAISFDDAIIDENGEAILRGTFVDIGTEDTHDLVIDWGDGSLPSQADIQATVDPNVWSFEARHVYLDDNPTATPSDEYLVVATLSDDDGGIDIQDIRIAVDNVAPVYVDLSNNAEEVGNVVPGEPVVLTGVLTDPGTKDTFTVDIDWGDGTPMERIWVGASERTFTASYLYVNPGFFTITATITDDDGGFDIAETEAKLTGVELKDGVLRIAGTSDDDVVRIRRPIDPIAYWSFNETSGTLIADTAGTPQDGVFVHPQSAPDLNQAGPSLVDAPFDAQTAANFGRRASEYVAVAHDPVFEIPEGTIAIWFKTNKTSGNQTLFAKDRWGFGDGGQLYLSLQSNRIEVRLQEAGGSGNSNGQEPGGPNHFIRTDEIVQDDTWHHLVFTFGAGGMLLYLDAVQVGQNEFGGGMSGNQETIVIGGSNRDNEDDSGDLTALKIKDPFNGLIDEVSIYGEALDVEQINNLRQGGSRGANSRNGLTIEVFASFLPQIGEDEIKVFYAVDVESMLIITGAGDDQVIVDASIDRPTFIDAGEDNDFVQAGSGPTMILGGAGNDVLRGGASDDIVLGGDGNDRVEGGAGDDLLIGGHDSDVLDGGAGFDILIGAFTIYDDNQAALDTVFGKWLETPDDYLSRTARLTQDTGLPDTDPFLAAGLSVLDDQSQDSLTGGSGRDIFFADLDEEDDDDDLLTDRQTAFEEEFLFDL